MRTFLSSSFARVTYLPPFVIRDMQKEMHFPGQGTIINVQEIGLLCPQYSSLQMRQKRLLGQENEQFQKRLQMLSQMYHYYGMVLLHVFLHICILFSKRRYFICNDHQRSLVHNTNLVIKCERKCHLLNDNFLAKHWDKIALGLFMYLPFTIAICDKSNQ